MKLSPHQNKVLSAFDKKNTDIDIVVLYTRIYGDPGHLTARECQQKLAPLFSALNQKIGKGIIEPGELKRTYRYTINRG